MGVAFSVPSLLFQYKCGYDYSPFAYMMNIIENKKMRISKVKRIYNSFIVKKG